MNIQTYIPVQGMIVCAEGGEYVKKADYDDLLAKYTSFKESLEFISTYTQEDDECRVTLTSEAHLAIEALNDQLNP